MLRVCGQCGPWIHLTNERVTKVETKPLKMETYLQPFPLARGVLVWCYVVFLVCFALTLSSVHFQCNLQG